MIETIGIVEPWLYETLSQDPVLQSLVGDKIVNTLAPETMKPPYVAFFSQSLLDVVGVGGIRISTDNLYVVKAVGLGASWDVVQPIAARIDYLIHRPGSVMQGPGQGSLTCTRERTFQAAEVDKSLQYRHLGGVYRIRASADE